MATPAPSAPSCSRCGTPGAWYAATSQWGCDRCQMLPMQQGQVPMAQSPFGVPAMGGVPQMQPVGSYVPPPVSCPRCGTFATYYAQTAQWGCDRCRQPVAPMMVMRSGSEAQSSAGATALKVIGAVIAIIILTALRVAIGR